MTRSLVAMGLLIIVLASCDNSDGSTVLSSSRATTTTLSPSITEPASQAGSGSTTVTPQSPASTAASSLAPLEIETFYGRVIDVDFGSAWSIDPPDVAITPGAVAGTTVGPASVVFKDGVRLEVPARTPGGNACIELVRRDDWEAITGLENPTLEQVRFNNIPNDCFIYGALAADDTIAWFDIAEYRQGDPTATLLRRPISLADDILVLDGGISFPIAANVQILCQDVVTVDEYAADLPGRADRARVGIAIDTGEVASISCLVDF